MKDKSINEINRSKEKSPLMKENNNYGPQFFFEKKEQKQLDDLQLMDTNNSLESVPSLSDMSISEHTISSSETSSDKFSSNHPYSSSSSNDLSGLVNHQITSIDIELDHPLGEGASGTVFCGRYKGERVAIKSPKLSESKIDIGRITQSEIEEASESLINEKLMLEKISNTNTNTNENSGAKYIIKFYGTYSSNVIPDSNLSKMNLVIEYANGGSLSNWILDTSYRFEPSTFHGIAENIAYGLRFLHEDVGILHCDIKPDNILLQKNEKTGELLAKICDFGISIEKHINEYNGTLSHLAPEIILGCASHSEKSDLYSFGIVLWEIAAKNPVNTVLENESKIIDYAVAGEPLKAPKETPQKMVALTNRCLMFKPEERPSAREAIEELSYGI